jgi:hypothetical protein
MKERELSAIEKEINDRDIPMQHAISGSYTNENILNNTDGDEDEAGAPVLPEGANANWYEIEVNGDLMMSTKIYVKAPSTIAAYHYAKELAADEQLDECLKDNNVMDTCFRSVRVNSSGGIIVGPRDKENDNCFVAPGVDKKPYLVTAHYSVHESDEFIVFAYNRTEAEELGYNHAEDTDDMVELFNLCGDDISMDCVDVGEVNVDEVRYHRVEAA